MAGWLTALALLVLGQQAEDCQPGSSQHIC